MKKGGLFTLNKNKEDNEKKKEINVENNEKVEEKPKKEEKRSRLSSIRKSLSFGKLFQRDEKFDYKKNSDSKSKEITKIEEKKEEDEEYYKRYKKKISELNSDQVIQIESENLENKIFPSLIINLYKQENLLNESYFDLYKS
jgi:hypothetical protein